MDKLVEALTGRKAVRLQEFLIELVGVVLLGYVIGHMAAAILKGVF